MRVLIVEDDPDIQQQLLKAVSDKGYAVDVASTGKDALYFGEEYPIDVAIVDLGLPDVSGIQVIRQWREAQIKFPILILTARSRWEEKVEGLEAGADDYVVKPFQIEEVMARINALFRRFAGWAQPELSCGPITLNTTSQTVSVDNKSIDITAYEYKLLEYMMLNSGKVLSKMALTDHIYDQDFDRDSNVIEVFIGRLRKKLDPDDRLKPIETLRGRGYRFSLTIDEE